jgi:hypothetical protein
MRGEREIALTTPVRLTAFQPSPWDGSSLLRFQAFHAWLPSQVPTGQNPTGSQAMVYNRFAVKTVCQFTELLREKAAPVRGVGAPVAAEGTNHLSLTTNHFCPAAIRYISRNGWVSRRLGSIPANLVPS